MPSLPLRRIGTGFALLATAAIVILSLQHGISSLAEAQGEVDGAPRPQAVTNNAQLEAWLHALLDQPETLQGGDGVWQFTYAQEAVVIMTDERANRMRIMTAIGPAHELDDAELIVLLAANFDRALDARYCIGRGQLWSAFIHPLGDLSAQTFADALNQVVTLKKTFGTTYSSTGVRFGQPNQQPQPDHPDHAI